MQRGGRQAEDRQVGLQKAGRPIGCRWLVDKPLAAGRRQAGADWQAVGRQEAHGWQQTSR